MKTLKNNQTKQTNNNNKTNPQKIYGGLQGVLWYKTAQLTLKQNLGYPMEIEERILPGIWDESLTSSGKWICH